MNPAQRSGSIRLRPTAWVLKVAVLVGAILGGLWLTFIVATTASVTIVNKTGQPTQGGFVEINSQVRPIRPLAPGASQTFFFTTGGDSAYFVAVKSASGKFLYGGGEYLTLFDVFVHRRHQVTASSREVDPATMPPTFGGRSE